MKIFAKASIGFDIYKSVVSKFHIVNPKPDVTYVHSSVILLALCNVTCTCPPSAFSALYQIPRELILFPLFHLFSPLIPECCVPSFTVPHVPRYCIVRRLPISHHGTPNPTYQIADIHLFYRYLTLSSISYPYFIVYRYHIALYIFIRSIDISPSHRYFPLP